MYRRLLASLGLILAINTSNAQQYVTFLGHDVNKTQHILETKVRAGIFKVKNVGYQGPNEKEIDQLKEFTVHPDDDTETINKMIVKASKAQQHGKIGGKLVFEPGLYVVSGLELKSNVHIRLQPKVILEPNQSNPKHIKKAKWVFGIGKNEKVTNVSILGLGMGTERAIIRYKRESDLPKTGGARAFTIGAVTNLFVQNIWIQDDQTRFSGVAFSFQNKTYNETGCAKNVTIDYVKQTHAAFGYGLIQSNAGKNLLFSNLYSLGGVCARLETDNRTSKSLYGVDNVHVVNVSSENGKAAVYLNPHTLINGAVYVNGAYGYNSQMVVEIRPGYKDPTGKGRYGKDSWIKNVTAVYGLSAPVQYSAKKSIPKCLLSYFDANTQPDKESKGVKTGPSVCVIGDFVGQIAIDTSTVKARIPAKETNLDNTVAARKNIVNGAAYRGKDSKKFCGAAAYE
ncbi:glycoside hydrolase family protein [Ochrovirga pacifica]|uniref:hypothetical protein n=1 Tax=Ochrovirga pacifica TaxID=1042376 RepID=UPI0002558B3F|nr:hypothetical protein [Ochrovirga pacifica]